MKTMDDSLVLVDTNVLLTATVPARDLHREALEVMNQWPNQKRQLCTSGQILREYLVAATRPFEQNGLGLEPRAALANIAAMRGRMLFFEEGPDVAERLQTLVRDIECRGKPIHDANIVALALVHGIRHLVTANVGDFSRFGSLLNVQDLATVLTVRDDKDKQPRQGTHAEDPKRR